MKITLILLLFLLQLQLIAQPPSVVFKSPYKLSPAVDMPLALGGATIFGTSFILSRQKQVPTDAFIQSLNATDVNAFDRSATRNYSHAAAIASDVFFYAPIAAPAFHLIDRNSRKDFGKISAMWAEVLLVNTAITNLTKEIANRPRPLMYNPNVPMEKKRSKENMKAFFSGHTSTSASMMFFFAKTYADYHPTSKWKPLVWTSCAIVPAITGILRWKAGKHYWTDVLTGYAVGALVGVGVPWLHQLAARANAPGW